MCDVKAADFGRVAGAPKYEIANGDQIIDALAKCLYDTMERLDPSILSDRVEWGELTSRDRAFFCESVRALLSREKDIRAILNMSIHPGLNSPAIT